MLVIKNYVLAFLFLLSFEENSVFAKTESTPKVGRTKKPACEADTVTRNCEFFRERSSQASITTPDGGVLTNPLHLVQDKDVSKFPLQNGVVGPTNTDYNKILYNQAEIIDSLENAELSTRFKVAYAAYAVSMSLNPQQRIELPWPPDEKNAPKKAVMPEEVETYIKEKLPENEYSHLQSIIKAQAIPVRAKWEAGQLAGQKTMELNKKAEEDRKLKAASYTKKQNRIKELFKYAQENIISIIRRGKNDSNLSKAEKDLIKRIETVQLTDFDSPKITNSSTCSGSVKNAFYSPLDHSMNVCPGIVMSSDAFLVTVISHELGHSIDPCFSGMPFWEVDQKKFRAILDDKNFKMEKEKLSGLNNSDSKYINYDFNIYLNNQDFVKKLIDNKAIRKIQDGIAVGEYPFKKESNCFVKQNRIRENSEENISITKGYLKKQAINYKEMLLNESSIERYYAALDRHSQCIKGITPVSQMKETVPDMLGALVEEKYILENPFKNEEEKVAALIFIENTCSQKFSSSGKFINFKSFSPMSVDNIINSDADDPHLSDSNRVTKIFLNLPAMAKIYDCNRTEYSCFDHLSFSRRMSQKETPDNSNYQMEKGTH